MDEEGEREKEKGEGEEREGGEWTKKGRERNYLLGLNAHPKHFLPLHHIWMLLDKIFVIAELKFPASVYPQKRDVLQEVFHIFWTQLHKEQIIFF